jgi:hypothetical protein
MKSRKALWMNLYPSGRAALSCVSMMLSPRVHVASDGRDDTQKAATRLLNEGSRDLKKTVSDAESGDLRVKSQTRASVGGATARPPENCRRCELAHSLARGKMVNLAESTEIQESPTMLFRWTVVVAVVLAFGTFGITALPAAAQWGRAINVNGQWLNPQQIVEADQIAGFHLPNGFYWWNPRACVWGVVGNPSPVGRAPCGGAGGGMGGRGVDWNRPGGSVVAPGNCEGGSCVNISPDLK